MKTKETSDDRMGKCEKCGATQFLSYITCNYNGICKGRVIPIETSTREIALTWWNNLPFNSSNTTISKQHFYDKYFVNGNMFTPAQNYSPLTPIEIEEIWKIELPLEERENYYGIYKPNQKQFKQFDESLFKAYIDKFSDEDLYKAHNILTSLRLERSK